MSFDLRELSLWGGKPVGFFKFMRGSTVWAYTTADRVRELDGISYTPAAIKRSAIKNGAERRKLNITVTIPRDLSVAANWFPYPARDRVSLVIYAQHDGESDYTVDWIGRVLGPKRGGPFTELTCEPTQTTASRAGLSRCWQRACPLAVYSQGRGMCNVDKAAHALPAGLTAVDSTHFTAAAFLALPTGRLAGGFIEYPRASDGVIEYRTIMSHSGDAIEIDFPLFDIAGGLAVTAYPGCRQTWEDCDGYFDNGDNYGGDLWMPNKNPHAGNPVW